MAGERQSWGLLGALALVVIARPVGCDKGDGADTALDATLTATLAAVGPEVVLPALDRFITQSQALNLALDAWSAAPSDSAAQTAAQEQWRATMAVWQELEVYQIGPAGSSLTAVAGEDLRDEVYSWPTINSCRVDQVTVEGGWDEPDFFEVNLVNVYGLDALEHLLFYGPDNSCPGQVDINSDGSWDALGEDGVAERRSAYARALGAQLTLQGQDLRQRWAPEGGDFSGLLTVQDSASPYSSQQQALNAVFDALFYLELRTKDRKLAQPLGLQDCADTLCPEDVEHLESGEGLPAIAANLQGFRDLFTGGQGAGLDDLLQSIGQAELSDEVLARVDTALATARSLSGPLDQQITDNTASITTLYEQIKAITDLLKGDLATVLVLQIPVEADGDAD